MFSKKLSVALDLGQHGLKCAVVEPGGKRVHGLWQAEIFPKRRTRDEKLEGDALRAAVQPLLQACGSECEGFERQVITAVQGEETVCTYLELPPLQPEELEVAVRSEAYKHAPFDPDTVTLSYVTVPPLDPKKKASAVFLVAARKPATEAWQALLKSCNLEVSRMEVPALPLTRVFAQNGGGSGVLTAAAHIGFRLTHFVIMRDGFPYYSREFALAGRDFTYGYQMGMQVPWEDAERHKLLYGLEKGKEYIDPFLMRFAGEVRHSIDFFHDRLAGKDRRVERLILSGGTAALKGFDRYLSETLHMPVTVDGLDRFKFKGKLSGSFPESSYNVAIGLGIEA